MECCNRPFGVVNLSLQRRQNGFDFFLVVVLLFPYIISAFFLLSPLSLVPP